MGEGVVCIDQKNLKTEHLNSIYEEMAGLIGLDMMIKIFLQYKGQQISFPTKFYAKSYVEKQIIEEFGAGSTYRELSVKYSYSERWVREIVKKYNSKNKSTLRGNKENGK